MPLEAARAPLGQRCAETTVDRSLAVGIDRATALVQGGAVARVFRTIPDLPALWHPA